MRKIKYNRIGGKQWTSIAAADPSNHGPNTLSFTLGKILDLYNIHHVSTLYLAIYNKPHTTIINIIIKYSIVPFWNNYH